MSELFRTFLADAVSGHGAHISFDQAINGFPWERAGESVPGLAHTAWMLVYHMRLAQDDIISYTDDPDHYEPLDYPSGYWPQQQAPPSQEAWETQKQGVRDGIAVLRSWALDPKKDLFAPLPHAPEHTLARQLTIIIAHNGYHIGQLVDLRMLLGVPVRDW